MQGLSDYAGWLYGQPGLRSLLLELQDEAGLDVLLLLTACWLGQHRVKAEVALWRSRRASQTPWQAQVLTPLRQVRRALADEPVTSHLYEQVKACELSTEWHQLAVLEQSCQPVMASADSAEGCMLAHLHLASDGATDRRIQQLATAALAAWASRS